MSAAHRAPMRLRAKVLLMCTGTGAVLVGWSLLHPALASQPPAPALITVTTTTAPVTATPAPIASGQDASSPRHLQRSQPVSLQIPALGLNARLTTLGQTGTGALQVPLPGPGYDQPGWYRFSPTPGSIGPAVIVGHVDSAAAGVSVFYRLGELQPGDVVSVVLADGRIANFRVYAIRRYTKAAFPSKTVYGNTTDAELRLITCSGAFDRSTGHYLDNTIVFASLVSTR